MRISTFVLGFVLLAACSKTSTPETTTPEPTQEQTPPPPAPEGDAAERPGITAAACEAQGGKVIGDIGDGAIHRPEYKCESGEAPVGSVIPDAGGPVAVEGSVCCK
ncbi:MAG: hypothetical protein IAG13_13740 [Deltaproteobacteria bacterium]|nr:hypothetical protein [Nannocystaceae bacterium]